MTQTLTGLAIAVMMASFIIAVSLKQYFRKHKHKEFIPVMGIPEDKPDLKIIDIALTEEKQRKILEENAVALSAKLEEHKRALEVMAEQYGKQQSYVLKLEAQLKAKKIPFPDIENMNFVQMRKEMTSLEVALNELNGLGYNKSATIEGMENRYQTLEDRIHEEDYLAPVWRAEF